MKPINDIRLACTEYDNIEPYPSPKLIDRRCMAAYAHRVALALRDKEFSLGEFDTLCLNFTPCQAPGISMPAARSVTKETAHLRYVDCGVTREQYAALTSGSEDEMMRRAIAQVLIGRYAGGHDEREVVREVLRNADEQGEEQLFHLITRTSLTLRAEVYTCYLDSAMYRPLLRVYDKKGNLLLEEKLPAARDLLAVGDVRVGLHSVTIVPRKRNDLTRDVQPMRFEVKKAAK